MDMQTLYDDANIRSTQEGLIQPVWIMVLRILYRQLWTENVVEMIVGPYDTPVQVMSSQLECVLYCTQQLPP